MTREEQAFHIACADYVRAALPHVLWWHTPNEGKRTKAEAGILQRMGVRPGVYDFVFALHQGGMGLIELKAKGGKLKINGAGKATKTRDGVLSKDQEVFGEQAREWGCLVAECWTIEEFDRALHDFFPRERFRARLHANGFVQREVG